MENFHSIFENCKSSVIKSFHIYSIWQLYYYGKPHPFYLMACCPHVFVQLGKAYKPFSEPGKVNNLFSGLTKHTATYIASLYSCVSLVLLADCPLSFAEILAGSGTGSSFCTFIFTCSQTHPAISPCVFISTSINLAFVSLCICLISFH